MSPFALFARFLRFGILAFGGPVAQIAMIRSDLVEREGWLSSERFNRLLAVYQALPGPEAHELCVHLGRMKGGPLGGLAAGLGFMMPGFLLVLGLAALYEGMNLDHPLATAAFLGAQIAVVALVAAAVPKIGRHILTDRWQWLVALAAFALALALGGPDPNPQAATASDATLLALFVAGLKGGLLTFGGAYTAIPFVRHDTVGLGWLSDGQFLDGLALSGMVPAPLVIFVTFTGYVVGGLAGALAMTAGMFLPAFAFGLLLHDRLEAVIDNHRLHRALDLVAAAVVGAIAATTIDLALALAGRFPALIPGLILSTASLAVAFGLKTRWMPLALLPAAALAGLALFG